MTNPEITGTLRRAARWLLCSLAALLLAPDGAEARPFRGQVGLSVLLCTFSDSPTPTRSPDFFRRMILGRGNGSLTDYWRGVSYGGIDFANAVVSGWHREPLTTAQAQAKSGGPNPRRGELVDDCIAAARNNPVAPYTVPAGHIVAVITSPGVDLYGGGGRAFLPDTIDIGGLGHEVGHGLGLLHSYSDDPTYRNVEWAGIGEYDDPWDVMSYANVFSRPSPEFGAGGPGLNAHHVDRMGWLARNRIRTFGADGVANATLTLTALNHPESSGYLLVRVPFDPADPFHYFTVEFRKRDGWDAGIPADTVLIHEVKRHPTTGQYVSYLLRERTGSRAPVRFVNRDGITIRVLLRNIFLGPNRVQVSISSQYPDRCLQGWVWREASAGDRVCVTPATRAQARLDNSLAASRRNPSGPYGPDTCVLGYVWREATPGDRVCVTPAVRTQARLDNEQAANRRNPARFVYGPNTCKAGYVWREADASDWVCVTPQVRTQTLQDNAAAPSRRNPGGPYGPNTCVQGYVWREAFPGDFVCVTPPMRTQAAADNREAPSRLMVP